jgi:hypothetical protein
VAVASKNKVAKLLEMTGESFWWLAYHLEHALVLTLEGLRRTIERIDPRLYSSKRRVFATEQGSSPVNGKRCIVFVLYCTGPLPSFTKHFIDAGARAGHSIIAVTNCPLHSEAREYLRAHCSWIIERSNVGRDFGAYKDGVLFALDQYTNLERLIIANDSVFYLPDGLDELITALSENHDLIGVSEVFEHHYHVASFLMSFGPGVLRSGAFRNFWNRYIPLSTRRWAIMLGEGRLSRDLLRAGFQPHILYPAKALHAPLLNSLPKNLEAIMRMLPRYSRGELYKKWGLPKLRDHQNFLSTEIVQKATSSLSSDALARQFIERVEAHNQMHTGGTLFRTFLGMPMIKRDLVYREVFVPDEISILLDGIDGELRREIESDLENKGTPARLGIMARVLHRHSAI